PAGASTVFIRQRVGVVARAKGIVFAVELLQCCDVESAGAAHSAVFQWLCGPCAVPAWDVGHHREDALVLPVVTDRELSINAGKAPVIRFETAVMRMRQAHAMTELVDNGK